MKKLLLAFIAGLAGCSSSETTTTTPPASSSSSGTASSSSGSAPICCKVSTNGESAEMPCGGTACVGNRAYDCSAQGQLRQTGPCASSSSSSSSSSGGGTATTVDCPGAVGAVDDKCDATKEYCILAKNGGSAATCAPFPPGCSSCSCASDNADAAWKKANNGTSNCGTSTLGTAVVTCQSTNGAVTVTCK